MSHAPRFAIARDAVAGHIARIGGAELHHMRHVMRLKVGALVSLIDERGVEYRGVITGFEPRHAVVEIAEDREPARGRQAIILAAAIIKGARMDFMVEKAAELGAAELWPLVCARSMARSAGPERIARWRRLAIAAAKQSLRPHPLEILHPLGFADLIRGLPQDTLGVICAIGAAPLGGLIARMKPRRILIACGPEGDFDPQELDAAMQAGFAVAGLGRGRLRSETAALAALSIAGAALDQLDGGT
jgi:16S rRNA (uracil1498-N3)-methyltransferase